MDNFTVQVLHEPDTKPVADIILLHGLGGDALDTWKHKNGSFFPNFLAEDGPLLRILSVNHPTNKLASIFKGGGMGIIDRSKATLDLLETHDLGIRPTIFLTHSLGGLITKAMLRKAHDIGTKKYQDILDNTAGVIFLATPHDGSAIANIASSFPYMSEATKDLKASTVTLKDLKDWYVQRANDKKIKTRAFFEGEKSKSLYVVNKSSAHPGTIDGEPTGVDANHIDICKCGSKDNATYRMMKKFIFDCLKDLQLDPTADVNPSDFEYYTSVVEGDRKTLEEKLEEGGRSEEVRKAVRDKERIAANIHRNAVSNTSQSDYKNFLGDIVSRFCLAVRPLIKSGESIGTVNEKVQNAVIDPVKSSNYRLKSQDDIHASIYYLTGNCHIWWSGDDND